MTVWGNEADHCSAVNRDISVIPNAPAATESHGEQNSREATLTSTPTTPPELKEPLIVTQDRRATPENLKPNTTLRSCDLK